MGYVADMLGRLLAERYRIQAVLGIGGMGTVYRAKDTRHGDVPVAVKVLHRVDPKNALRFVREAEATARISHPGIVSAKAFDHGGEQHPPFFVMDLLEGEPLSARLERGPLPLVRASMFALRVLEILEAVHAARLVHRDVKPSNIFLTRGGQLRLLDFGVAKDLQEAGFTTTGTLLGTPPYMAPEHLEGRAVDGRADLWAVGACLYSMLTGGGHAPRGTASLDEELRAAGVHLPGAFTSVLAKALARSVDDRFQDARAMAQALTPFARRPAMPARGPAALGVLLLGGGVAVAWGVSSVRRSPREIPEPALSSIPSVAPALDAQGVAPPRPAPPEPGPHDLGDAMPDGAVEAGPDPRAAKRGPTFALDYGGRCLCRGPGGATLCPTSKAHAPLGYCRDPYGDCYCAGACTACSREFPGPNGRHCEGEVPPLPTGPKARPGSKRHGHGHLVDTQVCDPATAQSFRGPPGMLCEGVQPDGKRARGRVVCGS
jgi:hypothetical protein